MATELAKAYVQIVPSARGIDGSIEKVLKGESESAGASAGLGIASKIKGAIAAAGIGAAIAKTVKASLEAGGALQQSFGGLETLYGDAAQAAKDYAYEAAQAGISANDYAEQAVSFGAGLKQAFGGDTQKAVEAANTAILDMADNAAKMGTPLENIQNAYQGFAKSNYTMLDNLKLGYGGTKEEMERLLADAEKFSGVKYDISNLGDVYQAIHVVQEQLGLAGVAADEAKETLSGSFGAMKASAENLLANMALGENIKPQLTNLATSTKNFLVGNLLPMIGNILKSVPTIFSTIFELAVDAITSVNWIEAGHSLINKIRDGVTALSDQIPTKLQEIGESAKEFFANIDWKQVGSDVIGLIKDGANLLFNDIPNLLLNIGNAAFDFFKGVNWKQVGQDAIDLIGSGIQFLVNNIPNAIQSIANTALTLFKNSEWIQAGVAIIKKITSGIVMLVSQIPTKIKEIGNTAINWVKGLDWIQTGTAFIKKIVSGIVMLVNNIPTKLKEIGNTAIEWIKGLHWLRTGRTIINTIVDGIKELVESIPTKIKEIGTSAIAGFKELKWLRAGRTIINKIVDGIKELITSIPDKLKEIASNAKKAFTDIEWGQVGKDIVNGIANGIKSIPGTLASAAKSAAKSALDAAKSALGIKSPSRVFRDQVGKMMALGMAEGFEDNIPTKAMIGDIAKAENAISMAVPKMSYSLNAQPADSPMVMLDALVSAVLDGNKQIAEGVQNGISNMKMVANNREYGRFIADLGFVR